MIFAAEIYGNDVFGYSHSQAIEDGELVDITEFAKRVGFILPVAVTHFAWMQCIERVHGSESRQTIKDRERRLKDLLCRLYLECRRNPWESSFVFRLFIEGNGYFPKLVQVELKAVIGCGDDGEAVIVLMLSHEDEHKLFGGF